ncbi:MAG: hypothetical protein H6605_00155 [Flavobacteriales bacterium]|nr:hypothetical protein [Flavobacteriales bacterium]
MFVSILARMVNTLKMCKLLLGLLISYFFIIGCKEPKERFSCTINKITIQSMPDTNYFGIYWDSLDGPDVFMLIVSNLPRNTVLQNTSERFENTTSYPISWDLKRPILVTDRSEKLSVHVCDFDGDALHIEMMACFEFNPSEFPDHPLLINLENKQRGARILLEVKWE